MGCSVCQRFGVVSFAATPTAQYLCDVVLWEAVLNDNPQLVGIVELGTWQGGFSWFLHMQAQARGLSFTTYDVQKPDRDDIPGFVQTDIYRYANELGLEFGQLGPIALFCDGGNKPRELNTFPPFLAPQSVILVHDWGTETLQSDVPEFVEELYGDFCDSIGSVTRVFRMKP